MIKKSRYFHSKVLLFGEYGILLGTKALAMPYSGYKGSLAISELGNQSLSDIYKYIKKAISKLVYKIDLDRFYNDLNTGLTFDSTIPLGSGLGSSAALVAALYKEFGIGIPENEKDNLPVIQKDLAMIESYYHGNSSGIDPLVSYVGKPLLFERQGSISVYDSLTLANDKYNFFLIESGLPGKTSKLVNGFLNKLSDRNFEEKFKEAYSSYSDKAIDLLTQGKFSELFDVIKNLSVFQLENMNELIPNQIKKFFKAGLETGEYFLKICGSGGGGFFLGMAKSSSEIESVFKGMPIHWLD